MAEERGKNYPDASKETRLILWDVDGTLTSLVPEPLAFFGRHLSALPIALSNKADALATHGRSEHQIIRSLLESNLGGPASEHLVTSALRILQMNANEIRAELSGTIAPLPGTRDALLWARERNIPATVVTGNSFQAACDKLAATALDGFLLMPCGGYAEDGPDKSDLIVTAIERCQDWHKCSIPYSSVAYIGDTPYDVKAAKQAGVRSIAVATGGFTLSQLRRENPFQSLRNLALDGDRFRLAISQL